MTRFLSAIGDLDSRLDVGLVYNDYLERVGDISVAHDNVQLDGVSAKCLGVAAAAASAFASYKRAEEKWSKCLRDRNCSTRSEAFRSSLNQSWRAAKNKRERAEELLAQV